MSLPHESRSPDALMRPEVLAQSAYQVADATGLIKLDAMENPHPWPGGLEDAWLEALRDPQLNRYPDAGARELEKKVRAAHAVPKAAGLLFGNGSDELIQILIMAVAASGRPILAPEPTFVMYGVLALAMGVPFVGVPLNRDFTLDLAAMQRMDRNTALSVKEAADGDVVMSGHAYVAPGTDYHLRLARDGARYVCRLDTSAPVNRHRPSVDVLFRSAAEQAGANVVAALLTGMGDDGAEGLLALREAGAHTVAQDEATSLVWGMPGEAVKRDAAVQVLPLNRIAAALIRDHRESARTGI